MSERPILFSGAMVRAILAGQKTQTRRVVKLRELGMSSTRGYDWCFRDRRGLWNDVNDKLLVDKFCPYGKPGDTLWVRETWGVGHEFDHLKPSLIPVQADVYYRATDDVPDLRWRPSLFMMRHHSRLTLQITNVRVERLQDISEEDAQSEGVTVGAIAWATGRGHRDAFERLWESINGAKRPWASNPFVWVVEFKRVEGSK